MILGSGFSLMGYNYSIVDAMTRIIKVGQLKAGSQRKFQSPVRLVFQEVLTAAWVHSLDVE